ncbi:UNKNOWN [Stylonychia lemnae]|uniref:Uncharacterized protein n=1 Tax=Stylonychia lemnae TaxID=5949 RepID=A0A078ACF5_STYLE|nr:UNKNOWN [Stylonychia lemnae]|eukprot:CDW79925.1 UNKNOWN [Stylonychia lemnae]
MTYRNQKSGIQSIVSPNSKNSESDTPLRLEDVTVQQEKYRGYYTQRVKEQEVTQNQKDKIEQAILNKVSKLFKEYYQDHGDVQTQRQMNMVREREQRRLKLQLKLLKLRQDKNELETNYKPLKSMMLSPFIPSQTNSTQGNYKSNNINKNSDNTFRDQNIQEDLLKGWVIQFHKNQLYNNLGLKQAINDMYLRSGSLDLEVSPMKSQPLNMIRSARDLGIQNQKLLNLKQLSNMKSHRQYMPLFDDFRYINIMRKNEEVKSNNSQHLRPRTFNINLIKRKVTDQKINSMMITDSNLVVEGKFSQSLILSMVKTLSHCLSDLSAKLFNNNQTSWANFTNWLKKSQLCHMNIILEEITGITLQVGEILLIKFKDFPEKIGIQDPRYILNLDSLVSDECEVWEDNLLKFKEVRQFFFHAFDSYQLMTSQLGYGSVRDEEMMIMQGQIIEIRFKISEFIWLIEKYTILFMEDKATQNEINSQYKKDRPDSREKRKETQMQYIRKILKKTKKIIRSKNDPEFEFKISIKNAEADLVIKKEKVFKEMTEIQKIRIKEALKIGLRGGSYKTTKSIQALTDEIRREEYQKQQLKQKMEILAQQK